jgi:hypothetical protein
VAAVAAAAAAVVAVVRRMSIMHVSGVQRKKWRGTAKWSRWWYHLAGGGCQSCRSPTLSGGVVSSGECWQGHAVLAAMEGGGGGVGGRGWGWCAFVHAPAADESGTATHCVAPSSSDAPELHHSTDALHACAACVCACALSCCSPACMPGVTYVCVCIYVNVCIKLCFCAVACLVGCVDACLLVDMCVHACLQASLRFLVFVSAPLCCLTKPKPTDLPPNMLAHMYRRACTQQHKRQDRPSHASTGGCSHSHACIHT